VGSCVTTLSGVTQQQAAPDPHLVTPTGKPRARARSLGLAFQATEEAVINALVANEEMTGREGHRSPALPRGRMAESVRRHTSG
jgi:L-aminopeptidase/D-esterase-like protein